jgi:hypothetical protein
MRSRLLVVCLLAILLISCKVFGTTINYSPTSTPLPPSKPNTSGVEGTPGHVDIIPTLAGAVHQFKFMQSDCSCPGFNLIRATADTGFLDCSYSLDPKDSSTYRFEYTITQQSTVANLDSSFESASENAVRESKNLYSGETVTFPFSSTTAVSSENSSDETYGYVITSPSSSPDSYCGRGEELVENNYLFLEDINLESCNLPKPVDQVVSSLESCAFSVAQGVQHDANR